MAKHKVPLCSCETPLHYLENRVHSNDYKFKSDGSLYKNPYSTSSEGLGDFLFCPECNNIFTVFYDEYTGYTRGNLVEEH